MQMPALLLAILLAGGNPVWDRQSAPNQAQICSERAVAMSKPGAPTSQTQKARRSPACPAGARPLAEAAPAPLQAR